MTSSPKGLWSAVLLVTLGLTSATARADLLDDADDVSPAVVKPSPTPKPAAPAVDDGDAQDAVHTPAPSAAGKKAKKQPTPAAIGDDSDDDRGDGKDEASPSHQPGPGGTVIPPKKPHKTAGKGKGSAPAKDLPIHFENKGGLQGLREKGMVELFKEVVVTQGEMRMEADHAQIFFDEGTKTKTEKGVKKVIADGSPVRMFGVDENSGDKFHAFGNQVTFLNKDRIVVLEGNARLWRGEDSVIRSKKITYEMTTGWIRADTVAGEVQQNDAPLETATPKKKGETDTGGDAAPASPTSPQASPSPKAGGRP